MSTHFYLGGHRGNDDPRFHIGSRRAAGWYCWDCGSTLHPKGNMVDIHGEWADMLEACPKCGRKRDKEDAFSESSVGRELGFNKSKPMKKTGVKSCSSFTWAMDPERLKRIASHHSGSKRTIVDEYNRQYTWAAFQLMLLECPLQFHSAIGVRFC